MERVLYNTILGAWPIQADGTSFYYSDYATTGKKVWYGQKWPCCSGTFPQLAADYHISTYLRSADGVYVNLFTPSRVQWSDGGGRYGLKQETKYPFDNKIQIQVSASQPKDYTLYVRIPGWAAPDPVLSVNGKRVSDPVQPGTFAAIRRTWKDGDRVELELPMPLRLETVDENHPKFVALRAGPAGTLRSGRFAAQLRSKRIAASQANQQRQWRLAGDVQPTEAALPCVRS